MTQDKTIHTLEEPQPGSPIYARDFAAIIRALRDFQTRSEGYSDGDSSSWTTKTRSHKPYGVEVEVSADAVSSSGAPLELRPWSVFGVWDEISPFKTPCRVKMDAIGLAKRGSPLAVLTNGPVTVPAGSIGLAHHIDFVEPTRVRVTGITPPRVGHPCGVDFGEMAVSARGFGLVCMSEPDDEDTIWVMRTRDPVSVLGEITQELSAAGQCATLGSGRIKIRYKNEFDELYDAVDPATGETPWVIDVFSTLEVPLSEGLVHAKETMGIGLVVTEYPVPCSSSSTSVSSSPSSPTSLSSSSESSESSPSSSSVVCITTIGGLPFTSIPGYQTGVVQIIGHDASGCLRWYNVRTCAGSSSSPA